MPSDDLNPRAGKRSIDMPWLALIRKADPTFDKDRRIAREYVFGGRIVKSANPTTRGAYAPDPFPAVVGSDGFAVGGDDGTFVSYE